MRMYFTRTKNLYLLLICLFSMTANISAASEYPDALRATLAKLDVANNLNDYRQCRNQFEQMAQLYGSEWLPVYYVVYCDIQSVYVEWNDSGKSQWLNDTRQQLEKLNRFPDADPSEVSTLLGYYYATLVALDPESNGAKHFSDVLSFYNKAIEQNPENPRPVCLKAFFCQYIPESIRSGMDIAGDKKKAETLFSKEQPSVYKPYWGSFYLDMIGIKGNN